jgi:hypothetical protein
MDTPIINLETLNDKITNIVGTVNARNKSYMQNFAHVRDEFLKIGDDFLKIGEKMKMQDNLADQQANQITNLEDQIKELTRVINNEVLYYKDRRERPPNPDMYSGGFKSRKTRKSVNKRRKTVKKYN